MIDFMNTRTHVRDEILNQITIDFDHSRIKEDRRHLYVFNDIIVITKPQKKKKESFVIMFKTTDMKSVSPTKGETNLPQATPPHSIKISLRNKSDYYFNCLGGGVVINFIKDLQPLVVQAPDGADNTETPLLKESTDKKSKKVKTRVKAQTLKRGSIKAEDFKIMNNMESIKKEEPNKRDESSKREDSNRRKKKKDTTFHYSQPNLTSEQKVKELEEKIKDYQEKIKILTKQNKDNHQKRKTIDKNIC